MVQGLPGRDTTQICPRSAPRACRRAPSSGARRTDGGGDGERGAVALRDVARCGGAARRLRRGGGCGRAARKSTAALRRAAAVDAANPGRAARRRQSRPPRTPRRRSSRRGTCTRASASTRRTSSPARGSSSRRSAGHGRRRARALRGTTPASTAAREVAPRTTRSQTRRSRRFFLRLSAARLRLGLWRSLLRLPRPPAPFVWRRLLRGPGRRRRRGRPRRTHGDAREGATRRVLRRARSHAQSSALGRRAE